MVETRRSYNFGLELVDARVTSSGGAMDAWVRGAMANHHPREDVIVGLDCEWRPNTTPTMNNMAATLQLCVGSSCIIIQLVYVGHIPSSLYSFLANHNVVCVGVEVNKDADKLRLEYGITVARTVDLSEMALHRMRYLFSRHQPGLKTLVQEVLGLYMPKPLHVTRSDWERWDLDDDQIEYACLDAYASFMIGMSFLS